MGKVALRTRVISAIQAQYIWPAFQPIIDLRTGEIVSFEILARWNDPVCGTIDPQTFIPLLEKRGLIDVLFDGLVLRAFTLAAKWPGNFSLAVNISPSQLVKGHLSARMSEASVVSGFPLNRIEVEVTESSLITDEEKSYATLRELDALGVRIAIDDFGTGYSNLVRLEAFPFHKLKIDAQFVRSLDIKPAKQRIAAATIGLGQSLGMSVVAEGIESEAVAEILLKLGCELGQGWLFGKPCPASDALSMLMTRGSHNVRSSPLDSSPFQQLHQLRTIYSQAPLGLCFVDKLYRLVRVNDCFSGIRGMTRADLEGKLIHEVMDANLRNDTEEILHLCAQSDVPLTRQVRSLGLKYQLSFMRVTDLTGEVIGFSVISIKSAPSDRAGYQYKIAS